MRNFFKRKRECKVQIITNKALTEEQKDNICYLVKNFVENDYDMHSLAVQIMVETEIFEPIVITKIRGGVRVSI